MMNLSDLWKHLRFLQDPQNLTEEERMFLQRFLADEYKARERKRVELYQKQKLYYRATY